MGILASLAAVVPKSKSTVLTVAVIKEDGTQNKFEVSGASDMELGLGLLRIFKEAGGISGLRVVVIEKHKS